MFSKKNVERPKRRNHDLSNFGLTDIPSDFNVANVSSDECDSDLEAELASIVQSGNGVAARTKPKTKPNVVPSSTLDRMVADSLRDVGSEEALSEDDDYDDPELLNELHDIAGSDIEMDDKESTTTKTSILEEASESTSPTAGSDTVVELIKQRIENYTQAEANAKAAGDSGKSRRFARGLKTLNDLLKQANAGKNIAESDIPPEVSIKTPTVGHATDGPLPLKLDEEAHKVPTRSAPPVPQPLDGDVTTPRPEGKTPAQDEIMQELQTRQKEYKAAALNYKRSGDTVNALQFIKVVKQFDIVMDMMRNGQEVDLSDMPPPPDEFLQFLKKMQGATADSVNAPTEPAIACDEPAAVEPEKEPENIEGNAPPTTSMLEALEQRLTKYKSVAESAQAEGNASKARRFGRIVKQYEEAIKLFNAGQPVPYDDLPIPPGFGPLPIANTHMTTGPTTATATVASTTIATGTISAQESSNAEDATVASSSAGADDIAAKRSPREKHELTTRTSGNQQANNLAEQQMKTLLMRQREFKVAALEAKKAGEIDQAKEYLKIFKGFDALLNAASNGLPVDLTSLPVPPSQRENLEASFAIISKEECNQDDEDISEIGYRIEEQLAKQLMMCKNTRDHHKAMGDIAGMNRFENLAISVQKDLDLVRYSKGKNLPLPKFHYEKKSFNIVHCNTDLSDQELEIMVIRGINYNVANPKEVDTFVRIEFALLNDEVFRAKTNLVKDTESPDYNQRFNVEIQRGNRQFQRIFKRHGIKFEVYSRGGFFRSDVMIGTVNVKLQPLETKCEIHETFDLMEGRKAIGGKLEVKIRVRNPILTKQIEHLDERWLLLDN